MQKPVKLWLRTNRASKKTYYLEFWQDGKRRYQSLGHDDETRAEWQRAEKQLESGRTAPAIRPGIRLVELCSTYLAATARLESSTRDLTRYLFGQLVEAVGDLRIDAFGPAQAERFQTWLIQTGRGQTTANSYCKCVRPPFRWALRQRMIGADPFEGLSMFRCPDRPVRILEPAEFERLYQAGPTLLWKARLLLAKTAGLRRGEVMNLTRADVDLNRAVIWVQPKLETTGTWRWSVKDKERRELPMVADLESLLRKITAELPSSDPYLMLSQERYQYLQSLKRFRALPARFRRVPDQGFDHEFRRMADQAGIRSVSFHDLRRTCITEWMESGLMPHEVRILAGHADIETTMKYYVATRRTMIDRARKASDDKLRQKIV